MRSSHMSGRQVPGSQISGRQTSGRQVSGSQASERQNGQPSNKLLLSGRQASQEGPARLDPSRQRALPSQGPSQGPNQGGRQTGSRQGLSRQQVLRRAVSSPKLDLIPEQAGNNGNNFKRGGGNNSSVPRLQLDFSSSTSASTVVPHGRSRRRVEERSRCGN